MRRLPWWGDGSAKGAASQVGLEGRGGSGHSGATAGSEWGDIRCVLWSELSGCFVWETGGGWGWGLGQAPRGQRGPSRPGRGPQKWKGLPAGLCGGEGEEAAGAGVPLPIPLGRSQATRSSRVLESSASSAAS